jgi:hypothetical protein
MERQGKTPAWLLPLEASDRYRNYTLLRRTSPTSSRMRSESMPWPEFGSQAEHHPGCDRGSTRRRISVFPRSGIPRKIRACSVPSGLSVAFSR